LAHKLLIFGLPGAGKTYLATRLHELLPSTWFNADMIRKKFDDWDFSEEGRARQATRMKDMAETADTELAICDFICPTEELRAIFDADTSIWIDTIQEGRFEDTNKVFEKPSKFTKRIPYFFTDEEINDLAEWLRKDRLNGDKNV
jgi:adenylylsulfate kinase